MTNNLTSIAPSFLGGSHFLPHVQRLLMQPWDFIWQRLPPITASVNISLADLTTDCKPMAGFLGTCVTALLVVGCGIVYYRFNVGSRLRSGFRGAPRWLSYARKPNGNVNTPRDNVWRGKSRDGKAVLPQDYGELPLVPTGRICVGDSDNLYFEI